MSVTIEQKIMVAAKAFYDDCKHDDGYPHKDVSDQYDEISALYRKGEMSEEFINTVYELNK